MDSRNHSRKEKVHRTTVSQALRFNQREIKELFIISIFKIEITTPQELFHQLRFFLRNKLTQSI